MPRINQYTDNTTIENDDKMLTYDTQGAATKLTAFSTIWTWIVSKLHALTSSSAALTPSTDRVLMDKNGTMTRVDPASVAKYGIETYNGSTIAGQAQTVKSALDTLNSKSYQGVTTEYARELYVYKRGNVGFLKITDPKSLTSNATTTIATIPTGYRPDTSYSFYIPIRNTSTGIGLTIEAGGSVSVYNYSSYTAAININETVSYPLA